MANKTAKLTEDQVDEFKEVFQMHDKDKDNRINIKELHSVMKYLGQNVSPMQLSELTGGFCCKIFKTIFKILKKGPNGTIEYNKWLEFMAEKFVVEDTHEDVQNS